MRRMSIAVFLALACLAALLGTAHAQSTITGTVKDTSGACAIRCNQECVYP